MTTRRGLGWGALGAVVLAAAALTGIVASGAQGATTSASFSMVRSAGLPSTCAPNAKAAVSLVSNGPTETMTVTVSGLPANTDFDLFVIQVPAKPFGMSWYQGDIVTTSTGSKTQKFIGRFSIETFVVAPGTASAPTPHGSLDASSNPATAPVHMFHLGLWFNSPQDAINAHCASSPFTPTPFNGTHNAGPQVLNTHNFGNLNGPLNKIH